MQVDYAALVAACPVEDLSQALKFAPGEALLCLSAAVYEVHAIHEFLLDWRSAARSFWYDKKFYFDNDFELSRKAEGQTPLEIRHAFGYQLRAYI